MVPTTWIAHGARSGRDRGVERDRESQAALGLLEAARSAAVGRPLYQPQAITSGVLRHGAQSAQTDAQASSFATETPAWAPGELNVVWAADFMADSLYSGRWFRTLNVIDEGNRQALGIEVATLIPSA